ncbi:mobilisation protein (MobC) [Sphingomonas sp. OV641]|uniref:plasmid mobilization protein n=1 Tax=Sphingomonas sp. OV641 TaxID=1881068 RepID=UPI0008C47054|nr:plasmid mobilization relaxosome protein MobC [Sphingomonas sp. OV641]SEJ21206.1 mobilisation protein (MobC) [Sphingomonas sp. OV641]
MPGQRGSETRQRQVMYTIRWSPEEAQRLEEIAAASGCGKADVLRRLIAYDHSRIIPTRELTQQIAAIGNNLNQIARSINQLRARADDRAASSGTLSQLQKAEGDFRHAYDEIVAIRTQMENWR